MSRVFETECHGTRNIRQDTYPFMGATIRQGHFA